VTAHFTHEQEAHQQQRTIKRLRAVILSEKTTHVCYFWGAIGAADYRNDLATVLGCVTENVAYADKLPRLTSIGLSSKANDRKANLFADLSAANRRHDETLAHSPWFRL
jgi:hypothetical protein